MSELTEIKPILEKRKSMVADYIKLGWIFDKWYEKVLLAIIGTLGLWKIFDWLMVII